MRNTGYLLFLLLPLSVFSESGSADTIKGNQAFRDTVSVGQLKLKGQLINNSSNRITWDAASGMLLIDTSALTTNGGNYIDTNGCVNSTKFTMSSAQFLNAATTPVQLIAAPGANKFIKVLACYVVGHFGTTAYSGDGNPGLTYGNSHNLIFSSSFGDYIQHADNYFNILQYNTTVVIIADMINQPLNFWIPLGYGFTSGDGTFDFYLSYQVINSNTGQAECGHDTVYACSCLPPDAPGVLTNNGGGIITWQPASDILSLNNGLSLSGDTGQLGGPVTHNTSVLLDAGTYATGFEIGNNLAGTGTVGAAWVDSTYSGGRTLIGTGDFRTTVGSINTTLMASYNNDSTRTPIAMFFTQPDSIGSFRLGGYTNNGAKRLECSFIMDTSSYWVSSKDSERESNIFASPGLSGFSQSDSFGVLNGMKARDGGLDFLIGDTAIRFNNFTHLVNRGMVFQTDDYDNGVIGYLHSTRDSFTVNGTLSVVDGTQGIGKVLTSDAYGTASWQPVSAGALIHTDSIHLSSLQIDSLYDTPVQLVASPGAGHYIQILSVAEFYNYGTMGYTGGVIFVTEDNTLTGALYVRNSQIASATNGFGQYLDPRSQGLSFTNSGIFRGAPVTIYSTSVLTGGDGTVDIIISYLIR